MKRIRINRGHEPEPEHVTQELDHVEETISEPIPESIKDAKKIDSLFPSEHLQPLKGLLYLGALEKEVEYGGHTFLIRTLREGEIIRIGILSRDYKGTVAEAEARKVFVVAACIESVDDRPIAESYKEGYDQIYENYCVVKKWYPAVIMQIYKEYIDLEMSAMSVCDSLKK